MVPLSRLIDRVPARLSTKFVAASLAMSVLFVSLAVYSVDASRRTLEDAVGNESIDLAGQFALSVDRGVYTKLHEIAVIALGRAIINDLNTSNTVFDAMADPEEYIDTVDSEWTSVPMDEVTPFMEGIIDCNLSLDLMARLKTHYITEHGIDMYGEIVVTNKYGAVVAMTRRTTDYRQSDEAWWQTARDQVHHVGDIEYDLSADMYGLPVCHSVFDYDGQFAGVVRAFVGVVEIVMETQFEAKNYESTEVKIISADSHMIYSSIAYSMFDDVSQTPYVQSLEGDSGYFTSVEGERNRLYAYSTFPGYLEYPGQAWLVIMSHDSEEVLMPVTVLGSRIMVVSFVLLFLFLAFTFSLSSSITRPVLRLKKATANMARGRLEERVDIRTRDELGELGRAFNDMAADLQDMYEDLEAKVAGRTKEVAAANEKLRILGSITRHDSLNQLSILRGWLSMVEENSKDPKMLEHIRKVVLASETLEEQLKFTGEYEKVGVTNPEWVDLKLALDSSLPGLDLKGAKVVNGLRGLVVYADPMFPKVLRNLADNAVKHGKATKTISYNYQELQDGLVITVEDDGGGIPAEMKEKLFDRVRGESGRVGYGLYLSRAILAITGIMIKETGTAGAGARFEIMVPRGKYRLSRSSARNQRK